MSAPKPGQYRTPANLVARASLHQRFSTNPTPWHHWAFTEPALKPGLRVTEVGAGPGWLWRENLDRLPRELTVLVSDASEGMVTTAREARLLIFVQSR